MLEHGHFYRVSFRLGGTVMVVQLRKRRLIGSRRLADVWLCVEDFSSPDAALRAGKAEASIRYENSKALRAARQLAGDHYAE
ncbi:hypothetical protein [Streptomyces lycii]|uniref:Uncharacterized protein n=1 Tax=Streptomyces lycii TaxID=2654337 RepID=A0ABQ7FJ21_9ACTN|nr:hypothetical protein [Streptomyces lycii]KAF4408618.1 hypothetical protein GCU69_13035 [Streptomyces lycii]